MGIRQPSTCTALAHPGVGQRDARSRLWGYRGRLRAEHLQELVLDSRKQCGIEKVEHVLHAAKQAAYRGVPFATHLDRQYAAPQEDRADRVATQQAWVEQKHSIDLVIAWRLVLRRGARAARGWDASGGVVRSLSGWDASGGVVRSRACSQPHTCGGSHDKSICGACMGGAKSASAATPKSSSA